MYQGQQQPLPGSYYGPAVPPPQQPAKSRDCCCCLLSTAVKILIGGIIFLGVLAVVLWLILRPYDIKAHVTSASLVQFSLATVPGGGGRNLQYNLSTVVTLRNSNRRVGIYYDYLESSAEYEGKRFVWRQLPTFYQGHKNTTTLSPVFAGTSVVDLSNSDVSDFELQRQAGAFDVTLRLWGRIRYKFGSYKARRTTLRIRCNLQIPAAASGRNFTETRCRVWG